MKHFTLIRSYLPDRTVGVMTHKSTRFKTIELPWLNNKVNESCIPEGTYLVNRDKTGRHRYYAIQNVTNRTYIELHIATRVSHLLGCIGFSILGIAGLMEYVGDNSFTLTITHFNPALMTSSSML
jgi:hypothetical protein